MVSTPWVEKGYGIVSGFINNSDKINSAGILVFWKLWVGGLGWRTYRLGYWSKGGEIWHGIRKGSNYSGTRPYKSFKPN